MDFIICGNNIKPFKINIDPNKSILELKQVIACSLNRADTRFKLINNAHIIDESKNSCSIRECGINRIIRIINDYIAAPGYIEIVVVKPNGGRVKLTIDPNKSILVLKKEIASKLNIAYTGFNFLYEGKIFDDSKNSCTIRECEIEGEIVIIDNINGGGGPDYIKLTAIKRNTKPIIINIDQNKSILELKKEIASKYNSTNTGFIILSGADIIDNSKNSCTIKQCGIKRVVRIPDDYNPGFYMKNIFFERKSKTISKKIYSPKI